MRRTAAILLVVSVPMAACLDSAQSVAIRNCGRTTVDHLVVSAAGPPLEYGRLPPGTVVRVQLETERDGQLEVAVSKSGREVASKYGYVTPGLDESFAICIEEDGAARFEQIRRRRDGGR